MTIDKLGFKKTGSVVVAQGKVAPDSEVVVENKSLAPFAPADTPDVFAHAKAGADGTFSVTLPAAREGDRLQVRAGKSALAVRLQNVESVDGRPPVVRQQGLRLVAGEPGTFLFSHVCKSTVVGEPGQLLQVKNRRSGEAAVLTLDDEGRLPADAQVSGAPGDVFDLATSDGAHNDSFAEVCGALCAPLAAGAQPPPVAATGNVRLKKLDGPLFADGSPRVATAKQGRIGDCWLVSTMDAIAAVDPQRIKDMIKDNEDGTFTVTFQRYDHEQERYVPEPVTVDNSFYVTGFANMPAYGSCASGDLWFAVVEKAYAAWKGGYEAVRSGYPFEAFEAVLGAAGRHFDSTSRRPTLWGARSRSASSAAR